MQIPCFFLPLAQDCNGNLLLKARGVEPYTDLNASTSTSSLEPLDPTAAVNSVEDLPFFRDRSSSDSVAMGNRSSSTVKAKFSNRIPDPRPEGHTSPPAINTKHVQESGCTSGTNNSNGAVCLPPATIVSLTTSESFYVDPVSEFEESSSYKEVAHHHTWTCDENAIKSEISDNCTDLPLDHLETCSLKGIEELGNVVYWTKQEECADFDLIRTDLIASHFSECSRKGIVKCLSLETKPPAKLVHRKSLSNFVFSALSHEKKQKTQSLEYLASLNTTNKPPVRTAEDIAVLKHRSVT